MLALEPDRLRRTGDGRKGLEVSPPRGDGTAWSDDWMARTGSDDNEAGAPDLAAADAAARDMWLVTRVRRGDMEAYGELVGCHMRRAFSIANSILRHREDAEDIVQEAFIRALERIEQLEAGRPFHPWFYRIVVNRAISYHRARSLRTTDPLPDDLRALGPSPDREAERSELRARLLHAVDELPEPQRAIVLLADVEELTSTEIGAILEMQPGTVRYHLHLGRRALRAALASADEEAR
jgi:RNA polymerase sigma-70 factor, ECF subfamily